MEAITMQTVKEIEEAILKLPSSGLTALREWFDEFDAKKWDEQFEADVDTGRLDKLAKKAIQDYQAGRCKKL